MSLHKTDYINIAEAIRCVSAACETQDERIGVQTVAQSLADLFASESRVFNVPLFLTNCGIKTAS